MQGYLEGALRMGREAARARMTSRAKVRRKTGGTTTVNGLKVPVWAVIHTDLAFRLVPKGSRPISVGGVTYDQATARGDVPYDTANLRDDDHVEITSGEWAGTVAKVIEAVKGDQRTARRLPLVEVPRPSEWV